MPTVPLHLRPLSADGRVALHSEPRHRQALTALANRGELPAVLRVTGNAVTVEVALDGRQTVIGRLSPQDAADYLPVLQGLHRQAHLGTCPVVVAGNPPRAQLRLGPPATAVIENSTAGLAMLTPADAVTVTREEHHQPALARYPVGAGPRRVAVELGLCTIGSGKYHGRRAIEVRLDGHRVGELTYAMSQRYAPTVDAVIAGRARPGCEALVHRGRRGVELTLRMPHQVTPTVAIAPPVAMSPVGAAPVARRRSRTPLAIAGAVVGVMFVIAAIAGRDTDANRQASLPAGSTSTTVSSAATAPTTTTVPTTATTTTTAAPVTTTTQAAPVQPPVAARTTTTKKPVTTTAARPRTTTAPPAGSGCNPNYRPCVPNASDVDCAGGSGNGPVYVTGPIEVIGSDPYGLDADHDGIGCE